MRAVPTIGTSEHILRHQLTMQRQLSQFGCACWIFQEDKFSRTRSMQWCRSCRRKARRRLGRKCGSNGRGRRAWVWMMLFFLLLLGLGLGLHFIPFSRTLLPAIVGRQGRQPLQPAEHKPVLHANTSNTAVHLLKFHATPHPRAWRAYIIILYDSYLASGYYFGHQVSSKVTTSNWPFV